MTDRMMSPVRRRARVSSRTKTSLLFAIMVVPYLWLANRFWFVCDDAFITFRYSRNLARGLGPRYNLGEHVPVEGYSNFLWMLLATPFEWLEWETGYWVPLFSFAAGLGLLSLMWHTLKTHFDVATPIAAGATLGLGLFPPFAVWSSSGLATVPQTIGMYAAWVLLALSRDPRGPLFGGLAMVFLSLVRAEGIYWSIVILVIAAATRWLEKRPIKPLSRPIGLLVVCFGAYYAWRYSYYQSLVANTAYAKVHMTPETLERGLKYVTMYGLTMLSPLLLLVAGPAAFFSKRWAAAASGAALAIGVIAYAVVVSGDYMTFFRILVPSTPFMFTAFAIASQLLWERGNLARGVAAAIGAAAIVVGVLPAFEVHLVPEETRFKLNVREKLTSARSEYMQWEVMVNHSESWKEKGLALKRYAEPHETYVAAAIGNTGYYSELFIYDRNGLVNREVAMLPHEGPLRSPGHDKVVDRSFFFDKKPDILDSKVVGGGRIVGRIEGAVREMEARQVRQRYAPELFPLNPRATGARRRFLVALRRIEAGDTAEKAWARYQVATDALETK